MKTKTIKVCVIAFLFAGCHVAFAHSTETPPPPPPQHVDPNTLPPDDPSANAPAEQKEQIQENQPKKLKKAAPKEDTGPNP